MSATVRNVEVSLGQKKFRDEFEGGQSSVAFKGALVLSIPNELGR